MRQLPAGSSKERVPICAQAAEIEYLFYKYVAGIHISPDAKAYNSEGIIILMLYAFLETLPNNQTDRVDGLVSFVLNYAKKIAPAKEPPAPGDKSSSPEDVVKDALAKNKELSNSLMSNDPDTRCLVFYNNKL